MNKISQAFTKGKAYMPFFICGDPNLATTAQAVREAVANGADLVELNIPFSDPTAGDAVIQEANIRALEGGVTTDKIFDMIRQLRKDVTVPFIISGYANVVFSYGADRFLGTCAEIGVDGLIVPDVPFEEREEFLPYCQAHGVDLISMVAGTSKERVVAIAKEATGFLYVMAHPGGSSQELKELVEQVRQVSDIPCAVCISSADAEKRYESSVSVDGIIEDEPIVRLMGQLGADSPAQVGQRVRRIKENLRAI